MEILVSSGWFQWRNHRLLLVPYPRYNRSRPILWAHMSPSITPFPLSKNVSGPVELKKTKCELIYCINYTFTLFRVTINRMIWKTWVSKKVFNWLSLFWSHCDAFFLHFNGCFWMIKYGQFHNIERHDLSIYDPHFS